MSDSTLPKKPTANQPETQFTTENIGRWAAKQENPFAEQNRKVAAKKQKQVETRKKATPYVVVIAAAAAISLAVFGLVMIIVALLNNQPKLPDDLSLGGEGAAEISEAAQNVYQEQLQKFYNQHGNNANGSVENPSEEAISSATDAMNEYFNNQQSAADEQQKNELLLIQLNELSDKYLIDEVIRLGESADLSSMTDLQKSKVWGMMANAYMGIGDAERANYYMTLPNNENEQQ